MCDWRDGWTEHVTGDYRHDMHTFFSVILHYVSLIFNKFGQISVLSGTKKPSQVLHFKNMPPIPSSLLPCHSLGSWLHLSALEEGAPCSLPPFHPPLHVGSERKDGTGTALLVLWYACDLTARHAEKTQPPPVGSGAGSAHPSASPTPSVCGRGLWHGWHKLGPGLF